MPADSSWKMPVVSPEASSSNVVASSSGMSSRSISIAALLRMRSTAWRRIVRFDRPRKSNLSRPSASIACISYWVISASEFVAFWSGISSVSGSRLITTPAAWVEALRATPSSWRAKSMIRFDRRVGVDHPLRSGEISSASSSLIPSWFGIALAIRSTSP